MARPPPARPASPSAAPPGLRVPLRPERRCWGTGGTPGSIRTKAPGMRMDDRPAVCREPRLCFSDARPARPVRTPPVPAERVDLLPPRCPTSPGVTVRPASAPDYLEACQAVRLSPLRSVFLIDTKQSSQ